MVQKTRTLFFPSWPVVLSATCAGPVTKLVSADAGAFSRRQITRAAQDRWYDARRIREQTGWTPKVPLREAIERTLRGAGTRRRDLIGFMLEFCAKRSSGFPHSKDSETEWFVPPGVRR